MVIKRVHNKSKTKLFLFGGMKENIFLQISYISSPELCIENTETREMFMSIERLQISKA